MRLHNDGPYPVTLTGLESTDPRLTPPDPDFDPMEIEPGSSEVTLASFDYDCDAGRVDDDDGDDPGSAVVAHLRAVDGTEHDLPLPINGLGVGFGSFMTDQCGFLADQPTFGQSWPEYLGAAPLGEDAVTVTARFNTFMGPQSPLPNIVEAESTGTAFLVSWDGDNLMEGPESGVAAITVTWTVGDCEAALVADEYDMVLRVTGQLPADDRTTTISAPPSTGLVAELVRLTERTCR